MGLIFAPFNVASSQDVPFHQPHQLQRLHNGSTKAYFSSPLCSAIPFSTTRFAVRNMTSVRDLGKCSASRVTSYTIHLLGMLSKVFEEMVAK